MKERQPIRVLIVPDKFKGTLSAEDACAAIARGWKSARPGDTLALLPMSDGGDGFGRVVARLVSARTRTVKTVNAAHQGVATDWWWAPDDKLAVIESARTIGLALMPESKLHPFQLDTYGLGRVLRATARVADRILIGIGGSATNDGGFGLARSLGWKFRNAKGRELMEWWQLRQLHRIVPPAAPFKHPVTVAVDVANPLLGPRGCSHVFGPQKGLGAGDIAFADQCLRRLSEVLKRQHGMDYARKPGAGAAGGLGFGLMAFAGAEPRAGFDVFADLAGMEKRLREADLVITGEGALDEQTCMGKGVGQVGIRCRTWRIPCLAVAGEIRAPAARKLFWKARALADIAGMAAAKKQPGRYLERLAASLAKETGTLRIP